MNLSRQAGVMLAATLLACNAVTAAASPVTPQASPQQDRQRIAAGQRLIAVPATPVPVLQASVGYAKIEVVVGESLAVARGGQVALGMQYRPTPVASIQIPGVLSYPIGPFPGGFDHTIPNADIRALLKKDEAQILDRCRSTLDYNKVDVIDTVHDTTIALTLNNAEGTVVASTSVPYQLGLTCKKALIAKISYAKIGFDINRPLTHASGGAVSLAFTYNGSGQIASVQPGGISYPLGVRQGPFENTIPNADIRTILQNDESAIRTRCAQTLEYNKASVIDTVHDTGINVTVNAGNGAVIASTSVPYQLGLTCRR